ncbi:hypothetical protein PGB28_19455 [Primorskyibacter aestuariivivens]|uniref:hypothetical protein n=1 Tax=Primorskyibacter aestuariivivens TaxID=1888912 RepID=UPI002301045A|nr:hypothetical protein [Primorskyibacter aestuariivivens]MDA7430645.1 hypothetical protein [Primorskyibacter aestuariivivens]
MSTNIRPEHISAFAALTSGEHDSFALFSCFLDGEPAVAIVAVMPPRSDEDEYQITPLIVGITENMVLTDHEGTAA